MSNLCFPDGFSGKEPTCQCRRHKRCRFDSWAGTIPWRRAWQPTPVFLPGKSQGKRSFAGYSPWSHKKLDMTEQLTCFPFTNLRVRGLREEEVVGALRRMQTRWLTNKFNFTTFPRYTSVQTWIRKYPDTIRTRQAGMVWDPEHAHPHELQASKAQQNSTVEDPCGPEIIKWIINKNYQPRPGNWKWRWRRVISSIWGRVISSIFTRIRKETTWPWP